jgi:hypothetical protein
MAMGISRFRFLAIAMVFHLVYIYSIFDVYFVSPIVTGMPLVRMERSPGTKAPADRLVLFVGMTVAGENEDSNLLTNWTRRWIARRQGFPSFS